MEHIKVFEELNSTNSSNDKETILRKYVDNTYIQKLLEYNLNPNFLMYVKKLPEFTTSSNYTSDYDTFDNFTILVNKLNKREITGNEAKDAISTFLSCTSPSEVGIYSKILLKSPIGVGTKVVNKVWPNLIPEFGLMLAPSELPDITKIKYPVISQPKLDGFRVVYIDGEFFTRTGKPFPNENLKTHFKSVLGFRDYVLDGELYDHTINFNKITSILNSENGIIPNTLKFSVYDCVSLEDWKLQSSKVEYQDRLKNLRMVLSQIADYKKIIDTPSDLVHTSKEVKDLYKKYLDNKYEGAMLKDPTGTYKWKRVTVKSGEMLKVKPFDTLDLEVKSVFEGEGKYQNMAGGVILDFKGTEVRCGSGFDDKTRKDLFLNQTKYVGRVAEIKYFEITEDNSLRFPTFERWRDDKA